MKKDIRRYPGDVIKLKSFLGKIFMRMCELD